MKTFNGSQIKGFAIFIFALIAALLLESIFFQTIAGILCAIGVSYILKFIPFKLKDLNFKPRKQNS